MSEHEGDIQKKDEVLQPTVQPETNSETISAPEDWKAESLRKRDARIERWGKSLGLLREMSLEDFHRRSAEIAQKILPIFETGTKQHVQSFNENDTGMAAGADGRLLFTCMAEWLSSDMENIASIEKSGVRVNTDVDEPLLITSGRVSPVNSLNGIQAEESVFERPMDQSGYYGPYFILTLPLIDQANSQSTIRPSKHGLGLALEQLSEDELAFVDMARFKACTEELHRDFDELVSLTDRIHRGMDEDRSKSPFGQMPDNFPNHSQHVPWQEIVDHIGITEDDFDENGKFKLKEE